MHTYSFLYVKLAFILQSIILNNHEKELHMNNFKEIQPKQISRNTFELIGKDWMLVTAGNNEKVNTMTASWGGMGVMWAKNVAYLVIRPQRYTKEFIDQNDTLSLSILDSNFRKELSYLGSVSGRDEDKIKKSGLTVAYSDTTPYFSEANLVFICKKMFAHPFEQSGFTDADIPAKFYTENDYHTLYVVEITKVLTR
jgi:Conserved protein/domain typically associated with flavoprotein oxygenases, DIM6/NTAB family